MENERQKFQMQKKAMDELNENLTPVAMVAKMFMGQMKGDKPTDAELIKLIKPLIPKPEKGEKGNTFKYEDFTKAQLESFKGKDGVVDYKKVEDFIVNEVKKQIAKLPKPKEVVKTEVKDIDREALIKEIISKIPKEDKFELDYEPILQLIKKEIDLDREKNPRIIRQFGGGGTKRMDELADVSTQNLTIGDALVWNGSLWVNRPISGSIVTSEALTAVQSGDDVTIDLTQLPNVFKVILFVTRQGQILTPTNDYSITGTTLTVFNSYFEDVFLVTYTY
jgi:hypothetical protein